MAKTLYLIASAVLALSALTASANTISTTLRQEENQDEEKGYFADYELKYYMTCGRGMFDGFVKGFYAN